MADDWDWLSNLKLLGMLPGMPNFGGGLPQPGQPPVGMPGVPGPGAGMNPYMPNMPPPDYMAPHFNPPGAMGMTGPANFPPNLAPNDTPPNDPGFSGELPPGWKPEQIGPTARAMMPPIPGVGPFGRNVQPPGDDGMRLKITPGSRYAGSPPMMGAPPESYDTRSLMGFPATPAIGGLPQTTDAPATEAKPDWWKRNEKLVGPEGTLWDAMRGMGRGLINHRPGSTWIGALGQGLNEANEELDRGPLRRFQRMDLEERVAERKDKSDRRKAWAAFALDLPADSPIKKWAPFLTPEKLVEKVFDRPGPGLELDPDTGKYKVNQEWLDAQLQMRAASGRNETALMKNAQYLSDSLGIPLDEAIKMAQPQGTGANSTDAAAMRDYLAKNPGKGAMDYLREKAAIRAGGTKPTAMMQNTGFLAKSLGISEAEAARITSQSKEQSDQSFYATIYRQAINSPMVAGDPQRADEIAKAAVQARRNFAGPGRPSAPAGRKTATGPGGVKIYTEDGGQTWKNMDGSPYR